ncbi:MAG: phosphoesterase [Lacunisphaera sp.]|nr:phosphoesterase [Lacunisphaera sp.]
MPALKRWKNLDRSEVLFLVGALAFSLGVWLFLAVADEVFDRDHQATEEHWMLALRNPQNPAEPKGGPAVAEIARDITALGGATVVVTATALVSGCLLLRRQWRTVLVLVATTGGGYGVSLALKSAYGRERPTVVPPLDQVSSTSFPSGHAMCSAIFYLTMGALLAHATPRHREKIYFIAAAGALMFLIGCSRVLLGVHYPTDVLAGWSAGTAWALLCWLATARWRSQDASHQAAK